MATSTSLTLSNAEPAGIPESAWQEANWLPCHLRVEIPVPGFTVRELLRLEVGSIVDTRSASSADVPLHVNSELIGWAEFEVVGDRLAVHAQRKLPYRFHFDPHPAFKSAFALPGGEIFVGGGVLALMDTEDQLAAVLGHEMEHVAQNQCRDRLIKELGAAHLTAETAEQLNVAPFFRDYGHEGELTADREGVKLSAEAGYSPEGAIRLLTTFLVLERQAVRRSHEAEQGLQDRIEQIQKLIQDDKLATPKEKALALP